MGGRGRAGLSGHDGKQQEKQGDRSTHGHSLHVRRGLPILGTLRVRGRSRRDDRIIISSFKGGHPSLPSGGRVASNNLPLLPAIVAISFITLDSNLKACVCPNLRPPSSGPRCGSRRRRPKIPGILPCRPLYISVMDTAANPCGSHKSKHSILMTQASTLEDVPEARQRMMTSD